MSSPSSSLYTIEDAGTSLVVTIPHRRRVPYVLARIAGIAMGTFLEIPLAILLFTAATEILGGHSPIGLVELAFLVMVFIVVGLALVIGGICGIMWEYDGREIIVVDERAISVRLQSYNLSRQRDYFAESVTNLRCPKVTRLPGRKGSWRLVPEKVFGWYCNGAIALDYEGMPYLFGCEIGEEEAERIVAAIKEKFPQYR